MKLQFIKQQSLTEASKDAIEQGYRLRIVDYIKNTFVPAISKKVSCDFDGRSLSLYYPKGTNIMDDKIPFSLGIDIEKAKGGLETSIKDKLTKYSETFSGLNEEMINEGPLYNMFARMAANRDERKNTRQAEKELKDNLNKFITEITSNPITIKINDTDITVNVTAGVPEIANDQNSYDIPLSMTLAEKWSIFKGELVYTEDGKSFDLRYNNKKANIFTKLKQIASTFNIVLEEPKFKIQQNQKSLKSVISKLSKDDIELYNRMGDDVFSYLLGLNEATNDIEKYQKAFKAADTYTKKGALAQWFIKKMLGIENCSEEDKVNATEILNDSEYNFDDKLSAKLTQCQQDKKLDALFVKDSEEENEVSQEKPEEENPEKEEKPQENTENKTDSSETKQEEKPAEDQSNSTAEQPKEKTASARHPSFEWNIGVAEDNFENYNWGLSLNKYIAKLKKADKNNGTDNLVRFKKKLLKIK